MICNLKKNKITHAEHYGCFMAEQFSSDKVDAHPTVLL